MTKRISDIAIGLVFAAGGVGICAHAAGLRSMPGMMVGSGLFPMITGIGMIVFGLFLSASAFLGLRGVVAEPAAEDILSNENEPGRRFLSLTGYSALVLAGLVAATFFIPSVGFMLCGIVFTTIVARLGGAGWIGSVIFAVVATLILYIVFVYGLRVPLPRGLWGL